MAQRTVRIAVLRGDGIGPEVIDAALPAVERAAAIEGVAISWEDLPYGAEHYLATGETLPEGELERLATAVDAVLLGAVGDPRVPGEEHARDILMGFRRGWDLYVNFRPCRLLAPHLCPLKLRTDGAPRTIDLTIFRENSEGLYAGRGYTRAGGTPDEEHVAEEVHTVRAVRRVIEAAFAWARAHGRDLVTLSDKSNAVPAHRLWRRIFDEVGEAYPEIRREHRYADALALELLQVPERFQVIVTNNLLGDLLSDLAAGLVGGLGVAPSANLNPDRPGLFEPVHGSAPAIAGRGVANPMAACLTAALMLEHLGLEAGASRLTAAVCAAIQAGVTTPDLGGAATTRAVGDFIAERVAQAR